MIALGQRDCCSYFDRNQIKLCERRVKSFLFPYSLSESSAKIFRGCHLVLMLVAGRVAYELPHFLQLSASRTNVKSCVWNEPMHLKQGYVALNCLLTKLWKILVVYSVMSVDFEDLSRGFGFHVGVEENLSYLLIVYEIDVGL